MDKTTASFEYPHYKTTTDEILFPEILFEAVYHSNHVYSHSQHTNKCFYQQNPMPNLLFLTADSTHLQLLS